MVKNVNYLDKDALLSLVKAGVAKVITKDQMPPYSLEPFEVYLARQQQKAADDLEISINAYSRAFQLVVEEFEKAKDEQAIGKLIEAYSIADAKFNQVSGQTQLQEGTHRSPEETTVANFLKVDEDMIEKIYQVAVNHYQAADYAGAKDILQLLLLLDPGYSSTWVMLGIVLKSEGKWEESLQILKFAIKMDPNNPFALTHIAECYNILGRVETLRS